MSLQGYNKYMERSHRDNTITVGRCVGQQTRFLGDERERIVRSVEWTEGPLHSSGRGYKNGLKAFAEVSLALTAEERSLEIAAEV
jgi:hypothetical protein